MASRGTPCEGEKVAGNGRGQDKESPRAANVGEGGEPKKDGSKDSGSRLVLGCMIERGCFNYRWPFNEYTLLASTKDRPKTADIKSDSKDTGTNGSAGAAGTCAFFSFVRNKIVYQVLRLEQDCHDPGHDSSFVLTIGGPIKFRWFDSNEEPDDGAYGGPDAAVQEKAKVDHLRISARNKSTRLEAKLYQANNDSPEGYDVVPLYPGDQEEPGISESNTTKSRSYKATLKFSWPATVVVAAFRLLDDGEEVDFPKPPTSEEIHTYMGIFPTSKRATGAMWESIFLWREEKTDAISELSEVKLIARCLEKILHVDLIPKYFDQIRVRDSPLAVVSNIFLQANIDLKALL
jgi:hypothetical protein